MLALVLPQLLTKNRLAAKLDMDRRTLARHLRELNIAADFKCGRAELFTEGRAEELRAHVTTPTSHDP